jgi:hypothetical protein
MPWWGWLLFGWSALNTLLVQLVHMTSPVVPPSQELLRKLLHRG